MTYRKTIILDSEQLATIASQVPPVDISGKANIDNPSFTTKITTPEVVLGSTPVETSAEEINLLHNVDNLIPIESILKTINSNSLIGTGDIAITAELTQQQLDYIASQVPPTDISGKVDITFETVSKNCMGYPYVITYNGDDLSYITYNLGGVSIVKTFNYTLGVLTSIVLSGNTPNGINLTKTLTYTGDNLTGVIYS